MPQSFAVHALVRKRRRLTEDDTLGAAVVRARESSEAFLTGCVLSGQKATTISLGGSLDQKPRA